MLRAYISLGLLLAVVPACASASEKDEASSSEIAGASDSGDCCPAIDSGDETGVLEGEGGAGASSDSGSSLVASGSSGCSDLLWREAGAVVATAQALVATATELTQRVSVACGSLHEELASGKVDPTTANATVTDLCEAAAQSILELGGTTPGVAVEGGQCSIAAADQLKCEASCSGGCTTNAADARCAEENLYVICDGSCGAGGVCQGSIETPARCIGQCQGACTGTCVGTCTSLTSATNSPALDPDSCGAFCDGRCEGTCTGECQLAADTNVSCGEAPCQGQCSESPETFDCIWPLDEAPASDCVSTTCYQACAGAVALAPNCVFPTVHVIGGFTASEVAALEAYLAPLLRAAGGDGRLAARVAPSLVEAVDQFKSVLDANPACMAEIGVENIGALEEAREAQTAIDAAVSAASLVVEGALGAAQRDSIL